MLRRLLLLHPSRLEGENRGVYEQHVASMQALLGDADGWQVHALDLSHPSFPHAALAAELVIVHMLAAPEVEAVIRLRRARNLATIFEISDNFLDLGDWLPPRHALRNPLVRQRVVYHASIADAVQVYAPGLAELCGHVNERVVLLDPYVPLHARAAECSRQSAVGSRLEQSLLLLPTADCQLPTGDGFVVGWGGTTSHEDDLALIAPVIAEFCRRHDDVTFAFIGNRGMGERLFGEIPPRQLRMREFSDYASYLDFVRTWDVGLAPMRGSGFNAGRTDTKVATYAACGVAPVLEECEVYRTHAAHALLYRGAEGLAEALESLYEDRARADEIASRARAWAERERGPERLRAQRIAAYEPLAMECGGEPPLSDSHADTDWRADTKAEACLRTPYDVDALRALVHDHPDYAQARLALADALRAAGDEYGALDVLDKHPFPPVLAGLAAERQHALAQRVRPERADDYASRVDSPVARVRLAHRGGDQRAFLRALLEEQPFDYFALSTILRELLAGDRDTDEVRQLCARACLIAPELVPPELRPPSLARFLPA
jgi:glycosyltransferase involved in cell wall biosynthesis